MGYTSKIHDIDRDEMPFDAIDLSKLDEVRIANSFIDHAVYQMTALELKCLMLIFATPGLTMGVCDFHGKELVSFLGMEKNKNAIKLVLEAFVNIRNANYYFFKGGKEIIKNDGAPNFLMGLDIDYKAKDLRMLMRDELRPYVLAYDNVDKPRKELLHTSFALNIPISLKRSQSIRLYILVKRLVSSGKKSKYIDANSLKTRLGIEEKYTVNFNGCIKRVLEPAQEEINQKTDVYFEIRPERKEGGRKFTGITLINMELQEEGMFYT